MTGVYSGTTLDSVGFFANIVTPLDSLAPFSFKALDIKHSDRVAAERVPRTSPTRSPTRSPAQSGGTDSSPLLLVLVLVRCSEEVARELYSGTEECEYYVGGNTYRALMALGTMLLMLSVALLGNCTWELKVFIGASYILLNGLYWGLGMMPRSYFRDLSRYEWTDVTPDDAGSAHKVTRAADQREGNPSFTRTLWYAIRETGLTGRVEKVAARGGRGCESQ
ncbi:hypothetical protein C2857_002493 [Epichloe festucae Fl1]|uniref:Uncharacterized protein n=1 Tax=Epichloe festucae (strain Fl1) TaxID=877507 RepID=A0A7U3Q050_EPIFF|nr:hypothetical protein C2857_002493 [Epichloe festucae Fl1]